MATIPNWTKFDDSFFWFSTSHEYVASDFLSLILFLGCFVYNSPRHRSNKNWKVIKKSQEKSQNFVMNCFHQLQTTINLLPCVLLGQLSCFPFFSFETLQWLTSPAWSHSIYLKFLNKANQLFCQKVLKQTWT